MFGLIYAAAVGIGCLVSGTRCLIENEHWKEEGRRRLDNPGNVYIDRKGTMRDLTTNRITSFEKDWITGDVFLRYDTSSVRSRNLSKEWRDRYYAELKEHPIDGKTVVNDIRVKKRAWTEKNIISINHGVWVDKYYCSGQWYKDLETGDLYVARRVENYDFYMKIVNGRLVRLTDDFVKNNQGKEEVFEKAKEILEKYNKSKDDGTWKNGYIMLDVKEIYSDVFYLNRAEAYCSSAYEEVKMMGMAAPAWR